MNQWGNGESGIINFMMVVNRNKGRIFVGDKNIIYVINNIIEIY
jgi:hypothetical protein